MIHCSQHYVTEYKQAFYHSIPVVHMGVLDLFMLAHLMAHITQSCSFLSSLCVGVCVTQMVKTTGGPAVGASVSSPAMTNSAITLLQDTLSEDERQLWASLGLNWTLPRSVKMP